MLVQLAYTVRERDINEMNKLNVIIKIATIDDLGHQVPQGHNDGHLMA
jgi:hypothetical protein